MKAGPRGGQSHPSTLKMRDCFGPAKTAGPRNDICTTYWTPSYKNQMATLWRFMNRHNKKTGRPVKAAPCIHLPFSQSEIRNLKSRITGGVERGRPHYPVISTAPLRPFDPPSAASGSNPEFDRMGSTRPPSARKTADKSADSLRASGFTSFRGQ